MKPQTIIALIITSLIFYACSGFKLQKYPSEECIKLPGDQTTIIIKKKCSFCHKGDFATKEMICSKKGIIIDSVTTGRMPKFGKLSKEEIAVITQWDL